MAEIVILVTTTWPDATSARQAGRTLVEEQMAACASLVPGVESVYRWKGQIETSQEVMLVLKTTTDRYPALERRIQALHSYELPEIVVVQVKDGLPAYLRWVEQSSLPPR